jgi:hypothetical protein
VPCTRCVLSVHLCVSIICYCGCYTICISLSALDECLQIVGGRSEPESGSKKAPMMCVYHSIYTPRQRPSQHTSSLPAHRLTSLYNVHNKWCMLHTMVYIRNYVHGICTKCRKKMFSLQTENRYTCRISNLHIMIKLHLYTQRTGINVHRVQWKHLPNVVRKTTHFFGNFYPM